MVADLESRAKSFEEEVAEAIEMAKKSLDYEVVNGNTYPTHVQVGLNHRSQVVDYLLQHQELYGSLHPAELDPRIKFSKISSILIEPTEGQAMNLAKAVDKAYCGNKEDSPLRHIKKISIDTHMGYLT